MSKSETVQRRMTQLASDPDAQLRFQVALSLGEWDDDRIVKPLASIAVWRERTIRGRGWRLPVPCRSGPGCWCVQSSNPMWFASQTRTDFS